MFGLTLLASLSKLSIGGPLQQNIRAISHCKPLLFKATPCLWGEPLKRKKKMDPQILKQREERRKRKMEKQIRRLEKHKSQLKPIDELEVSTILVDEKDKRMRPAVIISPEEKEYRQLLEKEWTRYKTKDHIADISNIDRIMASQRRALEALKEVSEDLYNAAIELDHSLVPYNGKGPVATPPIKKYDSPDGEYFDVSRKWDH